MSIIDTHAHLDHVDNVKEALAAAAQSGVTAIVAPGIDLASSQKNLIIKQETSTPQLYLAMGTHPSEAEKDSVESLVTFIRENVSILKAVGEIGLDFWYKWVRKDKEKKDRQREVFRTFLDLAGELNLPVIVHSRGAWRECVDTVKAAGLAKAVFHYYSGPVDVLKDILDAGYYVSTTPSVAYSPPSREAMAYAPIDQTMIETDSPVFFRNEKGEDGFTAQPRDVWKTLAAYSALKGIDPKTAGDRLNQNAKNFFGLDELCC